MSETQEENIIVDDVLFEEEVRPKLYCGDKENLPQGYQDFGSRHTCLKKGFGVGRGTTEDKVSQYMPIILSLIPSQVLYQFIANNQGSEVVAFLASHIPSNLLPPGAAPPQQQRRIPQYRLDQLQDIAQDLQININKPDGFPKNRNELIVEIIQRLDILSATIGEEEVQQAPEDNAPFMFFTTPAPEMPQANSPRRQQINEMVAQAAAQEASRHQG
jgi:hypothetical protein